MRARAKTTVMGLGIKPTLNNAKKFAADLAQLQARALAQTDKLDYLDQDSNPGHLNFELNKFGVALSAAIKADLRQHPRTALLEFYVMVMSFAVENKYDEIAARVQKGINDARIRDHVDYGKDVYELPPLDQETDALLKKINLKLEHIALWEDMCHVEFPNPDKCRVLYQEYMRGGVKFIPLIQSLLGMVAYSLEKANTCYDTNLTMSAKKIQLLHFKEAICKDLYFIEYIIRSCLPCALPRGLNFPALAAKFEDDLIVKVTNVPSCHQDQVLNKMLKLDEVGALLDLAVKADKRASQSVTRMSFFAIPQVAQQAVVVNNDNNIRDVYRGDIGAETESSTDSLSSDDDIILEQYGLKVSPRN